MLLAGGEAEEEVCALPGSSAVTPFEYMTHSFLSQGGGRGSKRAKKEEDEEEQDEDEVEGNGPLLWRTKLSDSDSIFGIFVTDKERIYVPPHTSLAHSSSRTHLLLAGSPLTVSPPGSLRRRRERPRGRVGPHVRLCPPLSVGTLRLPVIMLTAA